MEISGMLGLPLRWTEDRSDAGPPRGGTGSSARPIPSGPPAAPLGGRRERTLRLLLVPVVVTAAALTLSGCIRVEGLLHRTHEESFPDRTAAQQGRVGVTMPARIPADATDIHSLGTDVETNAVTAVTSASRLPHGCVVAECTHVPFDATDCAPSPDVHPDRVQACGDDEVVQAGSGWIGWFSATEQGQRPAAG